MSQKDVKQYQAWLKLTPEQQQKKIDDKKKKQIDMTNVNEATQNLINKVLGQSIVDNVSRIRKKLDNIDSENVFIR